ncbi:MAG: ferrous iron transport protein B [Ignavibacteriales bacterium]
MSVVLVGQPNVGKSVIMNGLTGTRAVVSNYPGTTVETTNGLITHGAERLVVLDTPGTYTLHSDSEDQRVTQRILMGNGTLTIVNVVDATNLARNLYLTIQLLDFELPMVIALNQMDRARDLGLDIDALALERLLGVPVVPLSATQGLGIEELKSAITGRAVRGRGMVFSQQVESSITEIVHVLRKGLPHESKHTGHTERALAIHLLEHDAVDEELTSRLPDLRAAVESCQQQMGRGICCRHDCYRDCRHCEAHNGDHPLFPTCIERTNEARRIALQVTRHLHRSGRHPVERIEQFIDRPSTGIPVLVAALFLSLRAVTAAVASFEAVVSSLAPHINRLVACALGFLPAGTANVLAAAIAEGLLLPVEVVLPAMLSVNILIALLEDSGLMSRFSVAGDRLTNLLALPGHAVIPIILGLGCRAPAILATRALADRRQRFIAVTLIAVAVPCAASLGLLSGLVARFRVSILVVVTTMVSVLLVLGALLGRYLHGKRQELVIEVPPLRIPSIRNVVFKTWMRSRGFLGHVLPLLLCTSIAVRLLVDSGILKGLSPLSHSTLPLFGIPGEACAGVVLTVLQRYLAPAVLLGLPLTPREATIACTMVSLSYPCLPVSVLILREMGWKGLLGVLAVATCVPVVVGITLNLILP